MRESKTRPVMRSAKEKSPASVMLTGLQCETWFAFEFTPPRAPSVRSNAQDAVKLPLQRRCANGKSKTRQAEPASVKSA